MKYTSIETEAENERALAMVERLMNLTSRTLEQEEMYELLVVLIEKFEREFYQPDRKNNPGSMLAFLMEQQDLQPIDLVPIFGSEGAVADAINGRSIIDRNTAEYLSEIFHVKPRLLQSNL